MAHQDDNTSFSKLSRKAWLNCICNHTAKQRIATDGIEGAKSRGMFPLEPIELFVHGEKMMSGTGEQICLLDIDKWLGVFSFTIKLVSKIMSAFCALTIDGLANGDKLPLVAIPAFSNDC
jgi:hypothetical protein